jgi:Tfp pilus assembly protein PilE
MSIVDLLVTIVVVTILVTIVLAIVTYVAYKLRLSREPAKAEEAGGLQYFVEFRPPRTEPAETAGDPRTHGHAAQA